MRGVGFNASVEADAPGLFVKTLTMLRQLRANGLKEPVSSARRATRRLRKLLLPSVTPRQVKRATRRFNGDGNARWG